MSNIKKRYLRKKNFRHGMDVLRFEGHHIYEQHLIKVFLSPFDSKRWITDNGVDTLAYGHVATRLSAAQQVMNSYIEKRLALSF